MLSTCILLTGGRARDGGEPSVRWQLALLRHPDQLERFRTDPGVQRSAIEEMLRYVSPVQMTARTITEDASSASVQFAAGDYIILLLASGNRDPEQFDDPERFDIARTPRTITWDWDSGSTTASEPPWPAWRPRWPWPRWCAAPPASTLSADDITYKSNVVMRGIAALPLPVADARLTPARPLDGEDAPDDQIHGRPLASMRSLSFMSLTFIELTISCRDRVSYHRSTPVAGGLLVRTDWALCGQADWAIICSLTGPPYLPRKMNRRPACAM